jgi:tetratricopeptide (TPR) repeat protein
MSHDRITLDAQALFERGYQSYASGDHREAVECFTRAIRLRPDVAAAYRYRALAYLELGQRTDALNDLDQAVRRNPDDPVVLADRARLLFRQKAYQAAIADCNRVLALDAGLAPIYGLRGECFAAHGDTERALADFAQAIAMDPEHAADYLLARANLYLEYDQYEQCIADCTAVLERDPENALAYQTRGLAYRELQQRDAAETDFSAAIRYNPNLAVAWLARATVRLAARQYAEAAADCDAALNRAPQLVKAFEVRGTCRLHLRDYDGALRDYSEAIRLAPQSPIGFNLRAGVHYLRREYRAAIQDHLEALKRDPKNAGTFNQLGWIWSTTPDPDIRNGRQAKECATRACELTEWQEPSYLDTLAAACAECGDFTEAVRWQKKAAELAPNEAQSEYLQRVALYESGKPYRSLPGSSGLVNKP